MRTIVMNRSAAAGDGPRRPATRALEPGHVAGLIEMFESLDVAERPRSGGGTARRTRGATNAVTGGTAGRTRGATNAVTGGTAARNARYERNAVTGCGRPVSDDGDYRGTSRSCATTNVRTCVERRSRSFPTRRSEHDRSAVRDGATPTGPESSRRGP